MENQSLITGIYLVAGLRFHPDIEQYLIALEQTFAGGVRLFQLRTKHEMSDKDLLNLARQVRQLTRKFKVTFIINDRPDIAKLSEADGLHLGPSDMSVSDARKIVGDILIGKSSHNFEEAQAALSEDIDYLSVGPIFETDCKPSPDPVVGIELLNQTLEVAEVPVVAIGGITTATMSLVRQSGVGCVGLIREIMAADDIRSASGRVIQAFNEYQIAG